MPIVEKSNLNRSFVGLLAFFPLAVDFLPFLDVDFLADAIGGNEDEGPVAALRMLHTFVGYSFRLFKS